MPIKAGTRTPSSFTQKIFALSTFLLLTATAAAQPANRIGLTVQESGGIRRTQFPTTAIVPLAQGALRDPQQVRLLLNQAAVPLQASAERRWPDGSVRELILDFNASPGPNESVAYTLEYGEGVSSEPVARGLAIAETADAIQIGNARFARTGTPLIASVKYRDETIGAGANGLVLTDTNGAAATLADAQDVKVEIVKRGPLVVSLKYTGIVPLGANARAPFTMTVEMPSSKSWIKVTAHVDDPSRRLKTIAVATPLALGALPWVWDFGTSRWTYGSLRNPADRVELADVSSTRSRDWTVVFGTKGREQLYERQPDPRTTFAGWGHIQGAREVVAFAVEHAPEWTGTTRVSFDGEGHALFSLDPSQPTTRHDIVVTEHFVSTPVQIGAATSPAAILSPLTVSVNVSR